MKLPSSKIYWTDYLAFSTLLSPQQICDVLKAIATRALTYPDENPQDNPQDNLTDTPQANPQGTPKLNHKLNHNQILKQEYNFNNIQLEFFDLLAKAQDESARDYMTSVRNGRKGGRPKKTEDNQSHPKTTEADKSRPKNVAEIIKQAGDALSVRKSTDMIFVDSSFRLLNYPVFLPYIEQVTPAIIESVENWLRQTKNGQSVSVQFITKQFFNFANRQGRPIFKEQTGRK